MKFLLDAHLPPGLCALLQAAGHDAIHTSGLTQQNRAPDQILNELSLLEQRVLPPLSPRWKQTRWLNLTAKK